MTDKEKIREVIARIRYKYRVFSSIEARCLYEAYTELINFIDSLPEEPVSKDLDEAARHYLLNEHKSPLNTVFHNADIKSEMQYHTDIENAYKAGVKWMANQ